MTPNLIN